MSTTSSTPALDSQPHRKLALRTVALAGNPNSGKTTLFNSLTGLRQKVANYPGVTVEKKIGKCRVGDEWIQVIDLPGTYSLVSRSPDEAVACEVLRGLRRDTPPPDAVIVVVDASNLARNLYLVSQLLELGRPLVVALSMSDVAERRGLRISAKRLEGLLGVPVVPIVGHKGVGVGELKKRLIEAKVPPLPSLELPAAVGEELARIASGLEQAEGRPSDRHLATAERLLIGDRSVDLKSYDQPQIRTLLTDANARLSQLGIDPMQADIEAHYRWIDKVAAAAMDPACESLSPAPSQVEQENPLQYEPSRVTLTDRLDSVLIHRFLGPLIFALVMAVLFYSVFSLADPIMGWTEDGISWLGGLVTDLIPEGALRDLWSDGIVAGVGGVLVFIPQIAILFGFLAILEDSGYLARGAFLMDRMLSKVGLSGKAFIPLLSSFACAIPGIMATRTIESRKQRLATILVAPFMSCSARLPVYFLLVGAFFSPWGSLAKTGMMFGLYALGPVAAALTAWALHRFGAHEPAGGFILELPTYKLPQWSQVLRQIWTNTSKFVTRAGTIIFCLSVLLWAAMYYPRLPESEVSTVTSEAKVRAAETYQSIHATTETAEAHRLEHETDVIEKALSGAQLRYSVAGRFGHIIEPTIRPLGYDWKMGVGLVGAFAAREVFVSTMGIVYSVGGDDEDTAPLEESMKADKYPDGRPVWTPAVAVSLLVWFVLAMQCMSTLAVVKRETGSWKWPVVMLLYMNGVAYVAALVAYQVLSRVM